MMEEKREVKRTLREVLLGQGVSEGLITQMNTYRKEYATELPEHIKKRIPKPSELYEGGDTWSMCITAILAGQHLLLSGGKATGKNTLATSLAFAFQRPLWNVSFHSAISSDELIGSDTFRNGEVVFSPGMAYECAQYGGFGVLDEINMAKESATAVLHSMLDHRRVIDVKGQAPLELHEMCTFIGTMNYGYSGTRPLNEALASRFVIPELEPTTDTTVASILNKKFPQIRENIIKLFAGLFIDLQTKAKNAEISTLSVDLRGIISALKMIEYGINPNKALVATLTNKSFEEFERVLVQDVVNLRIPREMSSEDVFGGSKATIIDFGGVR